MKKINNSPFFKTQGIVDSADMIINNIDKDIASYIDAPKKKTGGYSYLQDIERYVLSINSGRIYRPNVAAIILSHEYPDICKVLLAERIDMPGVWQFPQGGIDNGEDLREALFRELKEEIGTDELDIIAEYKGFVHYDFPRNIVHSMRPYDGQVQKYFLVKLRKKAVIDLSGMHEPEFSSYKFVDYDKVLEESVGFKSDVYSKVLEYFKKEGYI